MRRSIVLVSALVCVAATSGVGDTPPADWPMVGKTPANLGNNPFEQTLGVDTVQDLPNGVESTQGIHRLLFGTDETVYGQPVVYKGKVYFATSAGRVVAADANTLRVDPTGADGTWEVMLGASVYTAPAVTENFVYVAGIPDVYGLARATGEVVWQRHASDSTTLSGPGLPTRLVAFPSDPVPFADRVIVGVASNENIAFQTPPSDFKARGRVVAYDGRSGRELWSFHTTSDQSASPGPWPEGALCPDEAYGAGAGVWSTAAIDPARGLVLIGTGQGYEPPASCLSDSLLALDLWSGRLVWHYQFTDGDVWGNAYPDGDPNGGAVHVDNDVALHPNLFTVKAQLPGEAVPRLHDLVGIGDKSGTYRLFERDQAEGDVAPLATLSLEDLPPGHIAYGSLQSTPAFDGGVLYLATTARIKDGVRHGVGVSDFPGYWVLSTRTVAIDVRTLLETEGDDATRQEAATLWVDEGDGPDPTAGAGTASYDPLGVDSKTLTWGPLAVANGVVYEAGGFAGYVRAFDAATGAELWRGSAMPFPSWFPLPGDPMLGGVTVTHGRVYVPLGVSGAPGGVASFELP